ncbi:hypothetical protein Ddye_027678 [Dipteronia dyeriana]|uniref:HMA domain-containing protein n=1 Tax=Dipteronia dyeriana TaxID=168575 RepID=A0AAD9TQ08_9ROSI|nr:hypothetical protein Ddye_027678 [Dipteronia dyeriana]
MFFLVGLMMQQKIVIMLKLKCDKCRSKAMKIAAVADGVISVAWEGEEKNKVVMTGDGTDAATVTGLLRKKLGYADLVSVEQVQVRCQKCLSMAMKIIAVAEGEIFSVAWEGEDKDKVVVIGGGVDADTLTTKLDMNLGPAKLLLVEEVKEKKEDKKEVKKVTEPTPQCCQPYCPFKQQLCTQPSYPFDHRGSSSNIGKAGVSAVTGVMTQKIFIMLKLKCDKCRSKAMKIAAVADCVISVAWEGEEKNKVVMTGDGTDAATVTGLLRSLAMQT